MKINDNMVTLKNHQMLFFEIPKTILQFCIQVNTKVTYHFDDNDNEKNAPKIGCQASFDLFTNS